MERQWLGLKWMLRLKLECEVVILCEVIAFPLREHLFQRWKIWVKIIDKWREGEIVAESKWMNKWAMQWGKSTGELREAQSKRINDLLAQLHQMSRGVKYVLAKVPPTLGTTQDWIEACKSQQHCSGRHFGPTKGKWNRLKVNKWVELY